HTTSSLRLSLAPSADHRALHSFPTRRSSDLFNGIDVCGIRTRSLGYERRSARVRKKVQHLWLRRFEGFYRFRYIVPVDGLLRKDPHMFERSQPQPKTDSYIPICI